MSEDTNRDGRARRFIAAHCPTCLRANTREAPQCESCGAALQWNTHAAFRAFIVSGRQRAVRALQWAAVEFFVGLVSLVVLAVMLPRALQRGMYLAIVPWSLFSLALMGDGGRRAYRASRAMLLN